MPKIVDHDRYRQELLNRCLGLFAERGYGSLTMRQIAQGLGVSTGTLYHYFPSKEKIFTQLVQELCERNIADFFAHAPPGATLSERLTAVMTFFRQNYGFYQQQLLLWVEFYQHSQRKAIDNLQFLQTFWQQTRQQLEDYLQLPSDKVDFMLIFMDGLLLQCLYKGNQDDPGWIERQSLVLVHLLSVE